MEDKKSLILLTEERISLLQEISNGSTIEINSSKSFQLRFLSILLGNEELFEKINELFLPDFSEANLDMYIEYIDCCYNFSKLWPDFGSIKLTKINFLNFLYSFIHVQLIIIKD